MDFRAATKGISADELAAALHVQPQTVRQYRLDPSATGYRTPPEGWQAVVARIAHDKAAYWHDIASALTGEAAS